MNLPGNKIVVQSLRSMRTKWLGLIYICMTIPSLGGPSLQSVLAEVEDASNQLLIHESELLMLSERVDELDSKLQASAVSGKVQQLEMEQKVQAKTLAVLTASVKEIQAKFQAIQKSQQELSQDIRLLRRSLLSLVNDGSLEGCLDFTEEIPEHIHLVTYGETLSKIAAKYKLTVSELKKLNKLKSDTIYQGQKLRIKS